MDQTDATKKVREYFTRYPKRTYPKGQFLIFADENPKYMFFVRSGEVHKYHISSRGEEFVLHTFTQNNIFPMSWAVVDIPNRYYYRTEQPSEIHIVPIREARQFIENNPDVLLQLLREVYEGVDQMIGRVSHLTTGTAYSRLLYEIVLLCHDQAQVVYHSAEAYELRITEANLAGRTGLSRETVSREITKLKQRGLIDFQRKLMTIPDKKKLEEELWRVA